MSSETRAGEYLLHPAVAISIAVLVINDHWLKATAPSWWTGKLSDLAGMVFFPLIAAGLVDLGCHLGSRPLGLRARQRLVLGAIVATGIVFSSIQIWDWAGSLYQHGLGAIQWPVHAIVAALRGHGLAPLGQVAHTADPSDLIALPALLIPWWIARPRAPAS